MEDMFDQEDTAAAPTRISATLDNVMASDEWFDDSDQ
jgi:hypothetical protein